jgi:hypothetical protein
LIIQKEKLHGTMLAKALGIAQATDLDASFLKVGALQNVAMIEKRNSIDNKNLMNYLLGAIILIFIAIVHLIFRSTRTVKYNARLLEATVNERAQLFEAKELQYKASLAKGESALAACRRAIDEISWITKECYE